MVLEREPPFQISFSRLLHIYGRHRIVLSEGGEVWHRDIPRSYGAIRAWACYGA